MSRHGFTATKAEPAGRTAANPATCSASTAWRPSAESSTSAEIAACLHRASDNGPADLTAFTSGKAVQNGLSRASFPPSRHATATPTPWRFTMAGCMSAIPMFGPLTVRAGNLPEPRSARRHSTKNRFCRSTPWKCFGESCWLACGPKRGWSSMPVVSGGWIGVAWGMEPKSMP